MWPAKSRVGLGSAPARQIFRLLASSEPQRSLHGRGEIRFDSLSFDLLAEKIRPQKLAERGRVLRETTRRRSSPARLRNGSSCNCMTVFGMFAKSRRRPLGSKG